MFFFLSPYLLCWRHLFVIHFFYPLSLQSMIDELKIVEGKFHTCTPYTAINICKLKIMIHFPYEHIAHSIAENTSLIFSRRKKHKSIIIFNHTARWDLSNYWLSQRVIPFAKHIPRLQHWLSNSDATESMYFAHAHMKLRPHNHNSQEISPLQSFNQFHLTHVTH